MDAKTQNPSALPLQSLETSLSELIRFKDPDTHDHSHRVAHLLLEWDHYMKSKGQWGHVNSRELRAAARLHDVGKVGVLDEVLQKTDPLTQEERRLVERHSEIGYELIRDIPRAQSIALAVRHHHERWDGMGYPLGLKGHQIPLLSQLIAIVDTFDAITNDRPYQPARGREVAMKEIEENAGRQFNPEHVQSFMQFLHARNT